MKAEELGPDLDARAITGVLSRLKDLEYQGLHFEVADGSWQALSDSVVYGLLHAENVE